METPRFQSDELEDAWQPANPSARWRTMSGHVGKASGSALLEVEPGCVLPTHTDSAEEAIAVVAGEARVTVGDEAGVVPTGGVALVPKEVPHRVESTGAQALRFIAFYASNDVTTRYEHPVEPDGERSRAAF